MSDFALRLSLFNLPDRTNDKSPNMTGSVEIPVSELAALYNHCKDHQEENYQGVPVVKLRAAVWDSESKAGKRYLSGKITAPLPPKPASDDDMPF